jgi:hypothetical protein
VNWVTAGLKAFPFRGSVYYSWCTLLQRCRNDARDTLDQEVAMWVKAHGN